MGKFFRHFQIPPLPPRLLLWPSWRPSLSSFPNLLPIRFFGPLIPVHVGEVKERYTGYILADLGICTYSWYERREERKKNKDGGCMLGRSRDSLAMYTMQKFLKRFVHSWTFTDFSSSSPSSSSPAAMSSLPLLLIS